jgi:hypothetical protein
MLSAKKSKAFYKEKSMLVVIWRNELGNLCRTKPLNPVLAITLAAGLRTVGIGPTIWAPCPSSLAIPIVAKLDLGHVKIQRNDWSLLANPCLS